MFFARSDLTQTKTLDPYNTFLFSRDRDLLEIAADWLREGRNFSGLVSTHQVQVLIGQAVKDLEVIAKVVDPKDMENRVLRLPL